MSTLQTLTGLIDGLDLPSLENTYFSKYEYNGRKIPRVTTILSAMMHADTLMYWANNLGFKGIRYKEFMTEAANIGTEAHFRIEMFLKEKLESEDNVPYLGFKQWWNDIISGGNTIEVVGSEIELKCPYFGGTADALVKINGGYYLIDFKTSNHVTYKYFLQLAAYQYMLSLQGIYLSGVIVLQLDKEEVGYNEYSLHYSDPSHKDFMDKCTNSFFSLVYAFYNVREGEALFNNIYGEQSDYAMYFSRLFDNILNSRGVEKRDIEYILREDTILTDEKIFVLSRFINDTRTKVLLSRQIGEIMVSLRMFDDLANIYEIRNKKGRKLCSIDVDFDKKTLYVTYPYDEQRLEVFNHLMDYNRHSTMNDHRMRVLNEIMIRYFRDVIYAMYLERCGRK